MDRWTLSPVLLSSYNGKNSGGQINDWKSACIVMLQLKTAHYGTRHIICVLPTALIHRLNSHYLVVTIQF